MVERASSDAKPNPSANHLSVADRVLLNNAASLIEQLWERIYALEASVSLSARTSPRAVLVMTKTLRQRAAAPKKVRAGEQAAKFRVFHWDTFDPPGEDTTEIHLADTLDEAEHWVKKHYGDRLRPNGADRVDIVDEQGNVVRKWRVC